MLGVLGIAPHHPALDRTQRKVVKVAFVDSLTSSVVKGKRKKGGVWFDQTHPVCVVSCNDGNEYSINAMVRSRYSIQINQLPIEGYLGIRLGQFVPKLCHFR